MLYDSLHEKILGLPDGLRLFPSQTAEIEGFGSRLDTMLAQRTTNPGFQSMSREDFVRRTSLGMVKDAPVMTKPLRLRGGSVDEILRAQRKGAQVVDDRDPAEFSAACLKGRVNIPASAAFEAWRASNPRPIMTSCMTSLRSSSSSTISTRLRSAGMAGH